MRDFGQDVTFGYFFDEAFSKSMIRNIAQMGCNSPSLKYFLSTKASKKKSYHKLFESYGFEKVHAIRGLSKVGSNEKNTAYIYCRMECASNNRREICCKGFSEAALKKHYLDPAWSDYHESRVKLMEWMIAKIPEPLDMSVFKHLCSCDNCKAEQSPWACFVSE